jgi:hypothetical protein
MKPPSTTRIFSGDKARRIGGQNTAGPTTSFSIHFIYNFHKKQNRPSQNRFFSPLPDPSHLSMQPTFFTSETY